MRRNIILGQTEVMRRDFGIDFRAERLARSNERGGLTARNMLKQHARAGIESQRNIARNHGGLRRRHRTRHAEFFRGFRAIVYTRRGHERGLFLMERQDNVALRCLDHRAAAQSRARQIDAVIGQTGRSGREQRVKIGHFLALQALRDRAGLQNLNRTVLRLVRDIMDDLGRVAGRNGVRHADHRRVAACRSRSRAG